MTNLQTLPAGSAFDLFKQAGDDVARYKAGTYAITPVALPGFDRPVPPLFFDLPWADDDDQVIDGILAQLAAAADIEEATQARELRKAVDLVNRAVQIVGVAACKGDIEEARWGAYVRLTVSVDGGPPEILNVSAPQIAVTCWRLFCEGKLPCRGTFVELATAKKGRNAPLGFRVEGEL